MLDFILLCLGLLAAAIGAWASLRGRTTVLVFCLSIAIGSIAGMVMT